MTNTSGEFSVFQFFPDGSCECIADHVDAKTAVETAKDYSERPAAKIGIIDRIIITDSGDCTNFEWCFGQGVVYPPHDGKQFVAEP